MKPTKRTLNSASTRVTLIIPDTHFQAPVKGGLVAPEFCHDPAALSLILQVANLRKPDDIIHIGDLCEMGTISAWNQKLNRPGQTKGADGSWYQDSWQETMKMVDAFWSYIRTKHPTAKLHQLEGNHDYWSDLVFTSPALAPFASTLAFRNQPAWKNLDIKYYNYNGDQKATQPWVDIGRVRIMHGYKNVSAQRMRLEHDNVIYGHQHKVLFNSWDASSRESRRAWCIGCACKLVADYNSKGGQQNGWAQAMGLLYTLPDGTFDIRVLEIKQGRIVDFDGKTLYAQPLVELSKSLKVLALPE